MILMILLYHGLSFADDAKKNKEKTFKSLNASAQVGAIYRAPIKYRDNLYFLASSGTLYKSDSKFKKLTSLFQTTKKTISALERDNNILYFGDGLHHDEISFLYAYDMKKNKLLFQKKIKGHIEKKPIIYKDKVIFSSGRGGLIALNKKTGESIWKLSRNLTKALHIDSTPVIVKDKMFFTSIYENKGLYSAEPKSGKILSFYPSKEDIKNDLLVFGKYIISFETKALIDSKDRNISTLMRVFDTQKKKFIKDLKLRGHNFFIQKTDNDFVNIALSSGDIVRVSIPELKTTYLNLYPEPFMSSSFKYNKLDCFFSTLGRFSCYDSKGSKKKESRDILRAAFGDIAVVDGSIYIPTKSGYLLYKPEDK